MAHPKLQLKTSFFSSLPKKISKCLVTIRLSNRNYARFLWLTSRLHEVCEATFLFCFCYEVVLKGCFANVVQERFLDGVMHLNKHIILNVWYNLESSICKKTWMILLLKKKSAWSPFDSLIFTQLINNASN